MTARHAVGGRSSTCDSRAANGHRIQGADQPTAQHIRAGHQVVERRGGSDAGSARVRPLLPPVTTRTERATRQSQVTTPLTVWVYPPNAGFGVPPRIGGPAGYVVLHDHKLITQRG